MSAGVFADFPLEQPATTPVRNRLRQLLDVADTGDIAELNRQLGKALEDHPEYVPASVPLHGRVPVVPDLHVAPCDSSPLAWHWQSLCGLAESNTATRALNPREHFHLTMLEAHLTGNHQLPLVSIVIPVYNEEPAILRTTVETALAQTYPNCEVLLVDDGSREGLPALLGPLYDRVRCIRQPNAGVPTARNHGIASARGDFIHFLDADDLLDTTAVEEKLRVFFQVPDVEVCFNHYRCEGDNGVKSAINHTPPPVGDEYCPSHGLMRTVLKRFPFQISSMLFPRWVLLDVGPFELDLRQGQDNRHWFRLALRETKVAGINRDLNTRRFRRGSLTSRSKESTHYGSWVYLRNFLDLLKRAGYWAAAPVYFQRLLHRNRIELMFAGNSPDLRLQQQQLNQTLRSLPQIGRASGLSCAPLIEVLRAQLISYHACKAKLTCSDYYSELLDIFDELTGSATGITSADFRLWLDCPWISRSLTRDYPALRFMEFHLHSGQTNLTWEERRVWGGRLRQFWLQQAPEPNPGESKTASPKEETQTNAPVATESPERIPQAA